MCNLTGDLMMDVYLGDINKRYGELAEMSPERWELTDRGSFGILKNYLPHTYEKLVEEEKIIQKENYGLFNTGLFTKNYELIYAYLEPNIASGSQPFYLKAFLTEYDLGRKGIDELPERANYFSDPGLLIFDANCRIKVQYSHILEDSKNLERLPLEVQNAKNLIPLFNGALDMMKKKVSANYRIAIPQYYNKTIQLLLPLCLLDQEIPDTALVVSKDPSGTFYQGHTCLSLEMAYSNARLIAKPESNWLQLI